MKKRCSLGKIAGRALGIGLILNAGLFVVFYFDLDGKFLWHVVEPLLCKHYDSMERKDMLKSAYDIDKYPSYEYSVGKKP